MYHVDYYVSKVFLQYNTIRHIPTHFINDLRNSDSGDLIALVGHYESCNAVLQWLLLVY